MKLLRFISLLAIVTLISTEGFTQQVNKVKITELEKTIKESNGPLVINFWATFCKPCIEEMPYFESMAEKYRAKGIRLIFVSLDLQDDYPKKVNEFVKKRKIKSPVIWLDETNADYFIPKIDEKWSGSIPATLFINNKTSTRKFIEDKLTPEQLEKEIMAIL